MKTVTTRAELAREVASARAAGRRIGFVPTMGYLHEGHLALCDDVAHVADFIVMSIFVNPLQFGPTEDFAQYPRDLEKDSMLAAGRGVDVLYAPDVAEMYAAGETRVFVTADALESRLCGAFRPGHFRGVLTVVAKLFNMVAPDVAVFGQKDLQQYVLLQRMVRDLDFPIDMRIAPIVREADGLAMSSRNVYLSTSERADAPVIYRSLMAAGEVFRAGGASSDQVLAAARQALALTPSINLQYLNLIDVDTLTDVDQPAAGNALAFAGYLGRTRLIDNVIL
ncbi:MAG: pantoate--beta-alanine ligase [Longimicrobiales bacterium]